MQGRRSCEHGRQVVGDVRTDHPEPECPQISEDAAGVQQAACPEVRGADDQHAETDGDQHRRVGDHLPCERPRQRRRPDDGERSDRPTGNAERIAGREPEQDEADDRQPVPQRAVVDVTANTQSQSSRWWPPLTFVASDARHRSDRAARRAVRRTAGTAADCEAPEAPRS